MMAESLREFVARRKAELLAELKPARAVVAEIERDLADIAAAERAMAEPAQAPASPAPDFPIREVSVTIPLAAPSADSRERLTVWVREEVAHTYPKEGPLSLSRLRELAQRQMIDRMGIDISLQEIRLAVEALVAAGKVIYCTVTRGQPMMVSLPGLPAGVDGVGPAAASKAEKPVDAVNEAPAQRAPAVIASSAAEPSEPDWLALAEQIVAWLPDALGADPKGPTIAEAARHFALDQNVMRDAFRVVAKAKLATMERRGDTGAYHLTPNGYVRPREDLSPLQEEVLGLVISGLSHDGLCRLLPPRIAADLSKSQPSVLAALGGLRKKGYLEGSVDKKNFWHKPVPQTAAS